MDELIARFQPDRRAADILRATRDVHGATLASRLRNLFMPFFFSRFYEKATGRLSPTPHHDHEAIWPRIADEIAS